jgi:chromosome segregation ATPase
VLILAAAILGAWPGDDLTVRIAAVAALVLTGTAGMLAVHGLVGADSTILDAQEETARHLGVLRRQVSALGTQLADPARARDLDTLRADLVRVAATLEEFTSADRQIVAELADQVRHLTSTVRAGNEAAVVRQRALEGLLAADRSAAHTRAAGLHARLTAVETAVSALDARVTQLRGETARIAAGLRESVTLVGVSRTELTGRLRELHEELQAAQRSLTDTRHQIAALRAEQEGLARTGQASAVRMTLPLVRAALRQVSGDGRGDAGDGEPDGDQVDYAAPQSDGTLDARARSVSPPAEHTP